MARAFRVLITGGKGFVAPYVAQALAGMGRHVECLLSARPADLLEEGKNYLPLDIVDAAQVHQVIEALKPDALIHLAGVSDLARARANPRFAWDVNVHGTLSLAAAMRLHCPNSVFVFAGSGQVYGTTALSGEALKESDVIAPLGDYAVTKAAADLALGSLARQGQKAIRFRPFNHIGPGQTPVFALPSFAQQVARIERGLQPPVIRVGNIDAERDFLDVRDVARAYAQACFHPDTAGPVFNLASGQRYRMRDLLDRLIALSGQRVSVEIDPARWRDNEIPCLVGSPERAETELGWKREHSIDSTLVEILDEHRRLLAAA